MSYDLQFMGQSRSRIRPGFQVWCFDRSRRIAGCDHAARDGADRTLCGRRVEGQGPPFTSYAVNSYRFDPSAAYSCKTCVAAARALAPVDEEER